MNREDRLNKIMSDILELNSLSDQSGTLLLHGDGEELVNQCQLEGNEITILNSFLGQMDDNPVFNTLLTALFVTYLSNNAEAKAKFLEGLKLSDFNIGVN